MAGRTRNTELLAVLIRHGLTRAAAVAVAALGQRLRELSAAAGVEAAAMVDASTGEQLGDILPGGPFGVSIAPHLAAARRARGRKFVQIHTHVGSTSFSEDDAAVLVAYGRIAVVTVSALDGAWYVLSETAPRRASSARARRVIARFIDEYERLRPAYRQRVASGEIDESEARREHPHEVWQRVKAELGLRYDRVEPSDA